MLIPEWIDEVKWPPARVLAAMAARGPGAGPLIAYVKCRACGNEQVIGELASEEAVSFRCPSCLMAWTPRWVETEAGRSYRSGEELIAVVRALLPPETE